MPFVDWLGHGLIHGLRSARFSPFGAENTVRIGNGFGLLALVLVAVAGIGMMGPGAAEPWPEGAKWAYIERCADSLATQGLQREKAGLYCACITRGMEKEFGIAEYNEMIKAQPNPKGSENDLRLYRVFKGCAGYLSK